MLDIGYNNQLSSRTSGDNKSMMGRAVCQAGGATYLGEDQGSGSLR